MNRGRGQFGYGSVAQEYHDNPVQPYRDDPNYGSGGGQARSQTPQSGLTDSISNNIFMISNSANTLDRVLKQLGTSKDSSDLRKKIHETEEKTNFVITETANQFKRLQTSLAKSDRTQKLQMDRLMGEFKDITQKYHDLQKKVADRAKMSSPPASSTHTSDLINFNESESDTTYVIEQRRKQEQIQKETLETEVALLKERDDQIRQLESDILDINQIFRDLGTMVHDQGAVIDTIESNVESAHTDVELGAQQLERAADYQNKARKKKCCLLVTVLVIITIIVVIIVVSVETRK